MPLTAWHEAHSLRSRDVCPLTTRPPKSTCEPWMPVSTTYTRTPMPPPVRSPSSYELSSTPSMRSRPHGGPLCTVSLRATASSRSSAPGKESSPWGSWGSDMSARSRQSHSIESTAGSSAMRAMASSHARTSTANWVSVKKCKMCVQLETCVELASSLRRVVPSGSCWSTVYCSTQPWRKLSLSSVVSKRRPLELAAGGFKVTKNS
mmetsp:Transcript_6308/g.15555  ORF Transcript_6308/g.15555 Transcript_6308/m.15555 type:complete len:206 (-) Transcript_6308:160-777(-)